MLQAYFYDVPEMTGVLHDSSDLSNILLITQGRTYFESYGWVVKPVDTYHIREGDRLTQIEVTRFSQSGGYRTGTKLFLFRKLSDFKLHQKTL